METQGDLRWFLLLSVVWGWRTVVFQLSGFCRKGPLTYPYRGPNIELYKVQWPMLVEQKLGPSFRILMSRVPGVYLYEFTSQFGDLHVPLMEPSGKSRLHSRDESHVETL